MSDVTRIAALMARAGERTTVIDWIAPDFPKPDGERSTWTEKQRQDYDNVSSLVDELPDLLEHDFPNSLPPGLSFLVMDFSWSTDYWGECDEHTNLIACLPLGELPAWKERVSEAAKVYDEHSPRFDGAYWELVGLKEFGDKTPENEARIAELDPIVEDAGTRLKALQWTVKGGAA